MRFEPEDFVVEEIAPDGTVWARDQAVERADAPGVKENAYFTHFIVQKRLWTTANAVKEIARRLRVSQNRINYAGNKDRNAVTVQRCSVFCVPPEQARSIVLRDVKILGAWREPEKVRLGALAGNRFTIRLQEGQLSAQEAKKKAQEKGNDFPNFFGQQRFGSVRRNTHEVGRLLLQEKYGEAILNYLSFPDERETDARARQARKALAESGDYAKALQEFPMHLKLERTLLGHLAQHPNDYLGAFRRLHRGMQLLFIHAFQSHLFNRILEARVKENAWKQARIGDAVTELDGLGFPRHEGEWILESEERRLQAQTLIQEGKAVLMGKLIGYESPLSDAEKEILEQEGVRPEQFRLRALPELSAKGSLRPLFVRLKDFNAVEEEGRTRLSFSLPSGAYATTALEYLCAGAEGKP